MFSFQRGWVPFQGGLPPGGLLPEGHPPKRVVCIPLECILVLKLHLYTFDILFRYIYFKDREEDWKRKQEEEIRILREEMEQQKKAELEAEKERRRHLEDEIRRLKEKVQSSPRYSTIEVLSAPSVIQSSHHGSSTKL